MPFELGRPFGVPDDAAFQRRVLLALLALFAEPRGPVIVDFPEDAPGSGPADMSGLACPITRERSSAGEETLPQAIAREIRELQPWYDLARERRGRTTFGVSELAIADVARHLAGWLAVPAPSSPDPRHSSEVMLKLCSEDLKAFYLEALAEQPARPSARQLADWFWGETAAARLLLALRERCIADADPARRLIGLNNLVPREQWGRFGITERWWHKT